MSWKLTAQAPQQAVEAAIAAHMAQDDFDPGMVVGGSEVVDQPDQWLLEAWLEHKPTENDHQKMADLFAGQAPTIAQEELADMDWVTYSQQSVEPIRAGCFHIRTPDHPALKGGNAENVTQFVIPAAQAFGTGHHETTAGCLQMLEQMKAQGVLPCNVADIGTGTGLLGFAALSLWPKIKVMGSDIDPVCEPAVIENAAENGVTIGNGAGEMSMIIAAGMDDDMLQARAPYDLLIANILAGPLIDLAPDFANSVTPSGHLLLSGLLATQEDAVCQAYANFGFGLSERMTLGDWSILWLHRNLAEK